jgi:hypothetical protein
MDIQPETESEATLDRRNERLIAAGIRPPSRQPWPPPGFQTHKPPFYRMRLLWWPVRKFLRRFL